MIYLSVIIPAYNEEKRLPGTLDSIAEYIKSMKKEVEVIVVVDGSRDNTKQVAESYKDKIAGLRVLDYGDNRGKGFAVKTGMLEAKGEYVLFMDADNATPLSEVEKLWPFVSGYEIVIGSRHLKDSNVVIKQPWYRILISRLGNFVIQALIIKDIKDTQCGFKLFTCKAAQEIFSRQQIDRWGFDMEILSIAQKVLGYKIKEVPVSWYNSAESRLRPVRDALRTLRELLKIKSNLITGKYKKTA